VVPLASVAVFFRSVVRRPRPAEEAPSTP